MERAWRPIYRKYGGFMGDGWTKMAVHSELVTLTVRGLQILQRGPRVPHHRLSMTQTDASLGKELRRELLTLLDGGKAHATFDAAVKAFPANLRGVRPQGLPYSGWQIVQHLCIAQRDILDFCNNSDGSYKPMKWPDDYWTKEAGPATEAAWEDTLARIGDDRKAFDKLLQSAGDPDLIKAFAWGQGQTLLHEALLIADHNAYHTGELIVLRRLLGAWPT